MIGIKYCIKFIAELSIVFVVNNISCSYVLFKDFRSMRHKMMIMLIYSILCVIYMRINPDPKIDAMINNMIKNKHKINWNKFY